jgi:predicted GIY-YIG superfamily endonuclease
LIQLNGRVRRRRINRWVAGSSPACGAEESRIQSGFFIFGRKNMAHYVYILKSLIADKFYIDRTTNPDRRLQFENTTGKGFTAQYKPWKRVWLYKCSSKEEVIRLEKKIKGWRVRK